MAPIQACRRKASAAHQRAGREGDRRHDVVHALDAEAELQHHVLQDERRGADDHPARDLPGGKRQEVGIGV